MHYIKKQRNKPLYKKILPLRKNIQNRNKLLKFKKKKWQKFQQLISKLRKKRFYDPVSYFIFNFQNFFNRKLGKSYLKKLVRSILNELQFRFQKNKLKCTLKISNKKNNKWLFFWVNLSLLLLTIDSYGNTTFFVECQADSWPLVIDNETSPNTEIFESAAIPEQLNNVVQRNSHSSWIPREIVVTNTDSSEVSLIGDETFANDAVFEFDVLWEYLQSDLRLPSQFTETNKVLVYSTIEGSNPNCLIMLEEIWARVGIETVNFETGVANFNINNPSITGLWEIPFSRSRALSLFIGKVFLTELVCYDRHSNQSIVQHTCSFYEALIKGYYIDFEVSASGHNIGEFEKGIFWAVQWRYLTTGQDPHAIIREHFDTMFKGLSYLYWY